MKEHAQKSREYDRDVVNIEMELKREQAINARLESQVSSFKEKKKFEESIQWLKKKRALLVRLLALPRLSVYSYLIMASNTFCVDL